MNLEQHKNRTLVLWTKLKNGDVNALGDIYDIYVDELFTYGMQFSSDKSLVMDAIHDLFLNLYKYKKNLAATDNVTFYLYRSLKNTILKTSNNNHALFPNVQNQEQNSSDKSVEENIIQEEMQNERAFQLAKAVNSLSKKQKKGLFLRFTEERTYEEIADIMNVSVQTSRTIIYRAIKSLRKELLPLLTILFLVFQIFFN